MTTPDGPYTLAVDCGGTGIKALVLDVHGRPVTERARIRTPYPCPPEVLMAAVHDLTHAIGHPFDRASIGLPGLVRHGVIHATPHYVTEAGPFTAVRPDLVRAWTDFPAAQAFTDHLGRPTRVLNDTEIAGLAVIESRGFEVVLTLGTGLGCALFDDGRLLPKVELSQAPFRKGETYDQQLGHHARAALGDKKWSKRVLKAINGLRPVLSWDHLYLGGGGAKHVIADLGADVTIVSNDNGLLGGIRLWDDAA